MAQTHKINQLPGAERNAVIKALRIALTEQKSPNYQALTEKLTREIPGFAALQISDTSLFRFATKYVKPAIAKALAKSAQTTDEHKEDTPQSVAPQFTVDRRVTGEMDRVLVDDPIIRAVVAKRKRLESAIEATHAERQFDTYAKLESVDLKALEMHAKAIQHPGFVPAQNAGSGTTVQIAVLAPGTTVQIAAAETPRIELDVADIQRK